MHLSHLHIKLVFDSLTISPADFAFDLTCIKRKYKQNCFLTNSTFLILYLFYNTNIGAGSLFFF